MTFRRAPTLNLPNQLTVLRLGMCGLLLISLSFDWPYAASTALLIFSVASLTDWLDGAIARRWKLVTDLGKLLDPLADKILITGTLVALVERGPAPMWMVVIIIAREFLITGLRTIAALKQKVLAAERVGKHKTLSQIVVVLVSLAYLTLHEFGLTGTLLGRFLGVVQTPLYWFALVVTVYSGMVYFWTNAGILNESMDHASAGVPSVKPKPKLEEAPLLVSEESGLNPAFKEWEGIVEALGQGAQIILLRKGGIAEGHDGFQARHSKFWLFPTRFHQQWQQTRSELRHFINPTAPPAKDFLLHYFAEVTDALYITSWEQVTRLASDHFWTEDLLRERFGYQDRPGMKTGLHMLIVRVYRINVPHQLAPDPAYEGCKSWIEVPLNWSRDISTPVVRTEEFATRRSRILAALASVHPPSKVISS